MVLFQQRHGKRPFQCSWSFRMRKHYAEWVVTLKTRLAEATMNIEYAKAQTSSYWFGVEVRRGVSAQVSSFSLESDSKLPSIVNNSRVAE
ncbi:hypothetical protein TNCV_1124791 [Trichonephila clavipes]|uniref:Uncharacterized protein n=1 Tax=Trichonephila clavipes TaxID=2585209 RepID=A0A8X6VKF4_TRICX|nr:hypothetical protein TNCV_1124791 [Trichonephila clavipes]